MSKEIISTLTISPNAILKAQYSDQKSFFVGITKIKPDEDDPDIIHLFLGSIIGRNHPQDCIHIQAAICPTNETALEIPSKITYFSAKIELKLSATNCHSHSRQSS
jgi:hypothetical protein